MGEKKNKKKKKPRPKSSNLMYKTALRNEKLVHADGQEARDTER